VALDELFTAVEAGASFLASLDVKTVAPFLCDEALEDLGGFALSGGVTPVAGTPDAVLLGDLGDRWTVGMLNEAFRYVMDGARLVALQKNRYWKTTEGLALDGGPFVAAIEYATGQVADVCGKPNQNFYRAAREPLERSAKGESPLNFAMVGDDLWGDVRGAQHSNMEGWLVKTGKFSESELASSDIAPDMILDSLASLTDLF
jgi:phospholysine phosphohistidine inorganic pyrophosphate phosphatase